jgi:small-conductance mechanosensitive channel
MMILGAADCGENHGAWLCNRVTTFSDNETAADVARWLSPWVSILLIVLATFIVSKIVRRMLRRTMRRWGRVGTLGVSDERRYERAETIGAGLSSLASIILWAIAAVWILAVLGVGVATLLTSAGLIGVALAFGAQNLLRDLISGGFIIIEDQLGVGDVVDVGVASGTVEDVGLRTTRLRDAEGVVWYVPNGEIRRVGNKSQQWARAVIDIPISSGSDVDLAAQVIATTAVEFAHDTEFVDRILNAPEVLGVESFTLDTVTIRVSVKTVPKEQWAVARELRVRCKRALDAAGIRYTATPEPEAPR